VVEGDSDGEFCCVGSSEHSERLNEKSNESAGSKQDGESS
jgi:hypothetical protein